MRQAPCQWDIVGWTLLVASDTKNEIQFDELKMWTTLEKRMIIETLSKSFYTSFFFWLGGLPQELMVMSLDSSWSGEERMPNALMAENIPTGKEVDDSGSYSNLKTGAGLASGIYSDSQAQAWSKLWCSVW